MPQAIPFPQPAARLERRRILNDTTIRSLKPPTTGRVDYFDDLTPGLSLRVTSKNARTWTVFYRNQNGRQKRLTLGRYPAVKLVDARELAREAQRKVAHGGDPVVEKRAARDVLTFGALAKQYIDNYAKPNKRSWQEDERQLNASLLPKWKTRPAAEVSAEDLLADPEREGQGRGACGSESAACVGLPGLYVRGGTTARSGDRQPRDRR